MSSFARRGFCGGAFRGVEDRAIYKSYGEKSAIVTPGAAKDKGWIGQRYDTDAGLQYLNARYYDPELGMFLQPDWFGVTMPGVGTNRFAYGLGDPVNLSDPGGNCVWDACVGEAIAAAAIVSALMATDVAIDNANGGVIGDSPLGNPLGRLGQEVVRNVPSTGHNMPPSESDANSGKDSTGSDIVDGILGGMGGRTPLPGGPRSTPNFEAPGADVEGVVEELEKRGIDMKPVGRPGSGVYKGDLPGGGSVTVRPGSTYDGRPTVEVNRPKETGKGSKTTETRLGEKKREADRSDDGESETDGTIEDGE